MIDDEQSTGSRRKKEMALIMPAVCLYSVLNHYAVTLHTVHVHVPVQQYTRATKLTYNVVSLNYARGDTFFLLCKPINSSLVRRKWELTILS